MEEYCSVIITPDSVRDGVEDALINDIIKETCSCVMWAKRLMVERRSVDFIYPQKVSKPYFQSMVENFVAGYSSVFILKGDDNLSSRVKRLKGRFYVHKDGRLEIDGLRLKYGARIIKKKKGTGSLDVYEFRLHTSENLQEAAVVCAVCANKEEVNHLRYLAPPLYFEIQKVVADMRMSRRTAF